MTEFREALDDCGLQDLGFTGKLFTWWNKQAEQFAIFERLDRGVANIKWIELLPGIGVFHMPSDKSDHVPIRVTHISRGEKARKRKKQFRFEDMWLSSPECENVVKESWSSSVEIWNADNVLVKIKRCGVALQNWNNKEFVTVAINIKKARAKLVTIDGCFPTTDTVQERKRVCEELDKLLFMEETLWRQRSRV